MGNSDKQRKAASEHCKRLNRENNPSKRPEVVAKISEASKKKWQDKRWKARILRERKKRGYRKAPWLPKGFNNTPEGMAKYREFSKTREKVRALAIKHNLDIDWLKMNKEELMATYEALKNLPD